MNHRHLLPTEIDLLLDGEEGFGVAPLRAHVRECGACRARLAEAQALVDDLEALPLLAPSYRFADRVMAQVPIFVPWHVAAGDGVRELTMRWVPRSRPARVAMAAFATSVISVLTLGILWLGTRADLLVFASGVAGSQARALVGDAVRGVIVGVFGDQVLAVIQQTGLVGLAVAGVGVLAAGVGTAFGLRAIALASSRRRG